MAPCNGKADNCQLLYGIVADVAAARGDVFYAAVIPPLHTRCVVCYRSIHYTRPRVCSDLGSRADVNCPESLGDPRSTFSRDYSDTTYGLVECSCEEGKPAKEKRPSARTAYLYLQLRPQKDDDIGPRASLMSPLWMRDRCDIGCTGRRCHMTGLSTPVTSIPKLYNLSFSLARQPDQPRHEWDPTT